MEGENQSRTSSTESVERRDNVQSERKRGRGRGRGYRYNNHRGQGRRFHTEHDWRGGGDNASEQDRPDGQRQDRPDVQRQDRQDKQSRWSRDSRSNQDKNWRDASSSASSKDGNQDSNKSGHRRQKYPDKEIYSPRGSRYQDDARSDKSRKSKTNEASSFDDSRRRRNDNSRSGFQSRQDDFQGEVEMWDDEEDQKSDQSRLSKKNDAPSYEEGQQRHTDNRSGFRGGRGNFRGRSDRGRGRGSYEHKSDGNDLSQGRKGTRFKYNDSRSKTQDRMTGSGSKNDASGDVKRASNSKRIIRRETVTKEKADTPASQNAEDKTDVALDPKENKPDVTKENKPYVKKKHVISADAKPFVPGLRKSPTMGIDQDQSGGGKDVYQGSGMYSDKMGYGNEDAYVNAPVGVHAFGVYADPYNGAYGGEGHFDGGAEVSIGRGAQWNEWYRNVWHGTGPVEPCMHGERFRGNGRGFVPVMGRPGRGQYQNRQGRTRETNRQQDSQSYPYDNLEVAGGLTVNTAECTSTKQKDDNQSQPGFIRKGQDRAKTKQSEKTVKAKSAKQFSGSSDTQTGTLIEQLTDGTYECLVCCDVVKCEARVWSCSSCYTVFHLKCIKEWAKSPAAAAEDSDGWKCPACRFVTIHIPYVYKCFCGKNRDPPWEPGDTPHSCGEVCRRKRPKSNCTHKCNILCHPGPCPQCPVNVQRSCVCGKTKQTVRCGAVPVLQCQKACGKLLNCAVHVCERICHEDKCDDCQVTVVQGCYCGQDKREIKCGSSPDEEEGPEQFSCGKECGKDLGCGNHKCKAPCHTGACDPCPLIPETVKHCPCGQTLLDKLLELEGGLKERTKCTDPIPTCQKTCGKPLLCGGDNVHTCQQTCHEGDCGPCPGTSMVRCRCGHRYIDIPCAEITKEVSEHMCDRKCTKRKTCGKHKCQQRCCMDSNHQCTQICGRKLNCGVHVCEGICHPGNCIRCLEASFEELYCHCGAAVLMPPIPCGTKPPECTQQCVRRHKCDHPVRHTCHSEEECPPCAELSSKTCMGGHELRHNLPCYIDEVSCGKPCGRPLPCKQHTCQKTCHRGFCGGECSQPCRKPRPDCGHACNAPCHPDTPCPKQRCKAKVTVKCGCGNLSETTQCLQGVDDSQLTEAYQKMTTSAMAAQLKFGQSSVDMTKLLAFRDDKGQRILECTEECARIERNRRFADALNIHDPDLAGKAAPLYIPFLKEQAKKNPAFVSSVEKDFSALVKAVQSKYTSRSHAFAPMGRDQRRVIHELSDFYGLESQSYDQEPKRNVVITARRGTCHMPSATLTAVVQQELHPKAPTPIPLNSRYEDLRAASKAAKHSFTILERKKSEEKDIDYFEMT